MFALSQLAWLWAAAAVAVPIIIHLRNSKRNRTLKIGSIALLEERKIRNAGRLKLSDLLLLSLRCLLLLLITILLTSPYYLRERTTDAKGWIMVAPNDKETVFAKYKSLIDSLTNKGYELHAFADGFAELDPAQKITTSSSDPNYWTTVRKLDAVLPADMPVYIFTNDRQKHFMGERPAVSANIKWFPVANTQTARDTIFAAYETLAGDVRIVRMTDNDSATGFQFKNVSRSALSDEVTIDTTSVRITIYAPDTKDDANYLLAAIESIQQYTERKIAVNVIADVKGISNDLTWLFWLYEEELPAATKAENIFRYSKGKAINTYESMQASHVNNLSTAPGIYVRKMIAHENNNDEVKWYTANGKSVLAKDHNNIYRFYSRFSPSWSDLVWSKNFPALIADLVLEKQREAYKEQLSAFDNRSLSAEQIQPRYEQAKINKAAAERIDLTTIFGILAFIIFITERLITYRFRKGGRYA